MMVSPTDALLILSIPLPLAAVILWGAWKRRRRSYADRVRASIRRDNLSSLVPHTVASRGPQHHSNAYLDPEHRA